MNNSVFELLFKSFDDLVNEMDAFSSTIIEPLYTVETNAPKYKGHYKDTRLDRSQSYQYVKMMNPWKAG